MTLSIKKPHIKYSLQMVSSILLMLFSVSVSAQIFEAENATLAGGAEKLANSSRSGGFYVAQKDGNLTFDITLEEEAFYNIFIKAAAPGGVKTNNFVINEMGVGFTLAENPDYILLKVVSGLKLKAGKHQVKITKSWGWINIDYIQFEKTENWSRFDIDKMPVTPNSTPNTIKLYQFLYDNYGKKIISGAMTLNSMDEIKWLKANTGKEPALVGLDFMHCGQGYTWYNDEEPINDARNYYNRNGIPAFCWHWRDPLNTTEAFYTKDTKFDISKINDSNSTEYKAMIKDIDYVSGLLKKLQENDIPVLWRPLHEASGGWFWWGAKGAEPCKTLYRLMYDRMVNHHGLRNLIWIWTSQQNDKNWYPGDDVVDMIGRDIYKDGDHGSQILEFNQLNNDYGGKKMITLSETGSFPDVDKLIADEAPWSFFMPWYGDFVRNAKYNSLDLWKKMFAHDYVLTLDEMPNLKLYEPVPGTWRSSLYPENWKPGFKDSNDRFLHDFSYAGYHQGEKEILLIQQNIVDVTQPPYNADNTGATNVTTIIQKALNDVGQAGGGVVYLPAGIYKINPGNAEYALRIQYNNTVLRGAGTDSTFIFNDANYLRQKNVILMQGQDCNWATATGITTGLSHDLLYPTRIIPVKSVSGFKKGDKIILRTDGTPAFAEEHGMGGFWVEWAARLMFYRQIDSIDTKNNLIYIDSPTRYFMKLRDNARVYHAKTHLTESGIENLSIGNRQSEKSGWDEETYTISGTGAYDVHASHFIKINYSENCWVKNVNTYKPDVNVDDFHVLSNCLLINQSRGVTVDSCFFQKPQYEGGGGNGYMFTLQSNDCLIKNSRANHSRHNYDFKFPYSNGNVIYNCIGENSKYSSDFHMYLSPANLIDNFTVDKDYLESVFRPYGGDVLHGYSSTQSVFYNTKGLAYHSNKNYIIESRQYKHGYIIGTSGPAYQVKLDPVDGTINGFAYKTAPRDFAEGIGKGELLEPQSLYLDQLERRMNNTAGFTSYNVTIKIIDSNTGEPIPGSKVGNFDIQKFTDNSGLVVFQNAGDLLILSAEKLNYSSVTRQQMPIFSDTTFTFQLVPKKYNIAISVADKNTGSFFQGTRVTFNNEVKTTNDKGEVEYEVYPGIYDFLIEKTSYQNENGKLNIQSDTTFQFLMTRTEGSVKFRITEDVNTPVNNVTVVLSTQTQVTNSLGILNFRNLPVYTEYSFLIYKGGYNDVSGTLILGGDTTVNVTMVPYTTPAITNEIGSGFRIWPNPVNDFIYFEVPVNFAQSTVEILNLQGVSVRKVQLKEGFQSEINVRDIPSGMYLLRINESKSQVNQLFIKR
jgi:mannan endo-1,4-beta-mannosidase